MIIDADEFQRNLDYFRAINACPIDLLRVFGRDYGEVFEMPISKEQVEDWRYCGLNNRDFVAMIIERNKQW